MSTRRMMNVLNLVSLALIWTCFQLFAQTIEAFAAFIPDQIVVGFKNGVPQSTIDSIIASNGMSVIKDITFEAVPAQSLPAFDIYVLDTGPNTVEQALVIMKQDPNVEYAHQNTIYSSLFHLTEPTDPDYQLKQWGLNNRGQDIQDMFPDLSPSGKGIIDADIDAPQGWDHKKTGDCSCKKIAVLDSGADMNHEDLKDAIDAGGLHRDIVNVDNDPTDDNGHGTHVAGIIAMKANNGKGGAGVCWNAKLMIVKVLGANGGGSFQNIADGIDFALDPDNDPSTNDGASIINMSIGCQSPPCAVNDGLEKALKRANDRGVLVVVAAGNATNNNDVKRGFFDYPFPNIISVAASDNKDKLASFSNYGVASVDLAAPGKGIWSTLPQYHVTMNDPPANRTQNYDYMPGTSMAAPFVSGVAAQCWCLIKANMSYLDVKKQILNRVDPRLRK